MIYIAHRVNTVSRLNSVPPNCGIEVDLRDHAGQIILQHDPFKAGEDFQRFLKDYRHRLIILNFKSERIEERVIALMRRFKIKNYFLLDSSLPMMVALSRGKERRLAVRFSEFEPLAGVLAMKGKARWVWVDCFSRLPIDQNSYRTLKRNGFRLCLVSPDLQGRPEEILRYKRFCQQRKMAFDAVCVKLENMPLWET